MAPRKGAFTARQVAKKVKPEFADWTEQERDAAEQLAGLGLKTCAALYYKQDESHPNDVLDESGFFPEKEALVYVKEADVAGNDGQEYEVVYQRIAIRKLPSPEARVLGAACAGERLFLYEWDRERRWRKMHFRLRGGHGNLCEAWVMIRHPTLGVLLRTEGDQEIELDRNPVCVCGQVFDTEAKFCKECGTRRPELGQGAPAAPRQRRPSPNAPEDCTAEEPRGWIPQNAPTVFPANANKLVAKGNLQVMSALEVSYLALDEIDGDTEMGEDGCIPASSREVIDAAAEGNDVYEVVHGPYTAVRNIPSTDGRIVGTCLVGERVDTFGWDDSGRWRRVFGRIEGTGRMVSAWMMLEKPGVGALLELVETSQNFPKE